MLKIPLSEIPGDHAHVVDVAATPEELEMLLEGVDDFALASDPEFSAKIRLQRVGDAVRVAGHVEANITLSCGRCLEDREMYVEAQLEYMLITHSQWLERSQKSVLTSSGEGDDEQGLALTPEDLGLHYFDGEEIELGPLLREAFMLELPPYGVCPSSMRKECDEAYEANLGTEALQKNEEASIDPRWAKLLELKKKSD